MARALVRGGKRGAEDLERSLGSAEDDLVSKSHDAETAHAKERIALGVVLERASRVVSVAVDLDDEPRRENCLRTRPIK